MTTLPARAASLPRHAALQAFEVLAGVGGEFDVELGARVAGPGPAASRRSLTIFMRRSSSRRAVVAEVRPDSRAVVVVR